MPRPSDLLGRRLRTRGANDARRMAPANLRMVRAPRLQQVHADRTTDRVGEGPAEFLRGKALAVWAVFLADQKQNQLCQRMDVLQACRTETPAGLQPRARLPFRREQCFLSRFHLSHGLSAYGPARECHFGDDLVVPMQRVARVLNRQTEFAVAARCNDVRAIPTRDGTCNFEAMAHITRVDSGQIDDFREPFDIEIVEQMDESITLPGQPAVSLRGQLRRLAHESTQRFSLPLSKRIE